MASTVKGSMCYLDSSASFHMMGNTNFSSDLEEKDLHMHIEMGDGGRYNMTSIGKNNFQRELSSPLKLKDVLFVLLISGCH